MVTIDGPHGSARFAYDHAGRRIERTLNGVTTRYLYHGPQVVAELQGNAVGALYHTGLAIDEVLARYAGGGDKVLLSDALGSIIAESDVSGGVVTRRNYSPYGEGTVVGAASESPLAYTSREDDGTGLYYYRARYYDPQLKRFVSADPIGLEGGINVYGYVGGDPLSYTDSSGMDSYLVGRQLSLPGAGMFFGHAYIVYGAKYIGDSRAVVVSAGKLKNGKAGILNEFNSHDLSLDTQRDDRLHWLSLNRELITTCSDALEKNSSSWVKLNTSDAAVKAVVDQVIGYPSYAPLGPNSNATARAIASYATGEEVRMPSNRLYPGSFFIMLFGLDKNTESPYWDVKLIYVCIVFPLAVFFVVYIITYTDKTVEEGEAYGFVVGESKQEALSRLKIRYIGYKMRFNCNNNISQFKIKKSMGLIDICNSNVWVIQLGGAAYVNSIGLQFHGNKLIEIYRGYALVEMP